MNQTSENGSTALCWSLIRNKRSASKSHITCLKGDLVHADIAVQKLRSQWWCFSPHPDCAWKLQSTQGAASLKSAKPFCSYFAVMWGFTLPPGPADVHFSLKVFFFYTFTLLSFYSLPLLCRHASALFEILNQFPRDARVGRSQGMYQLWYVMISWHLMTILPDLQITFSKLTLNSYFLSKL